MFQYDLCYHNMDHFVSGTTSTLATTSIPNVKVMSPKDLEEACKQPIAVMTAVTMLTMVPINAMGMFVLFTKVNQMFNPNHVMANQRRSLNSRITMKRS